MSERPAGNLPADLSSFTGRRREVSEVVTLMSGTRLTTLTGTAGVGKTRMATHVAREVRNTFPDGVWLVELAPLREPRLVARTVGYTLGLHSPTSLADYLADKHLLLVLDNCEHVLDACANLVHLLLGSSPGLRILATSRHALCVPGEHLVDVPPLSLPEPGLPPLSACDPDSYEAIGLFAERAAAVRPGFEITAGNCAAVVGICTVLEGIPLAIEMAARRMNVLSAEEILARLDDRFALLTSGNQFSSARHQTFLAAVDWSFDLCSPEEQLLWTRLSVFSGGFDLAAAEAVGAGAPIAREDVVDLAAGLVRKSVLARPDHGARYRMLDTVRDYGRTRRSPSDEPELRRRHRDWYHRLTARFEEEWFGPDQLDWCVRLSREHANLRAALDFCLAEPGERQTCLAMATALRGYWITDGSVGEGHRWLTLALAAAPEPTPLRAKALWITGWLAQISGADGQAALDECRAMAERFGYRSAMDYALHYSGYSAMSAGDHATAQALYKDALARHRADGDEPGVTTALCELALCHCLQDDTDQALTLCAECIRRTAARGEMWCRSCAFYVQALILWRQGGHNQEAGQSAQDAIFLKRAINDTPGVGMSLELLAWIATTDGDHRRAAGLTGAAQRIWQAIGAPLGGIQRLLEYQANAEQLMVEALGVAGLETALRDGMDLTIDEAMHYPLDDDGPPTHDPASPLTRREWQVADLVAQGMTNKKIAASLRIVQRTAEAHVQHILAKLGFTSRARLAAWVVEQRVEANCGK